MFVRYQIWIINSGEKGNTHHQDTDLGSQNLLWWAQIPSVATSTSIIGANQHCNFFFPPMNKYILQTPYVDSSKDQKYQNQNIKLKTPSSIKGTSPKEPLDALRSV